jgi:hypothetical protein
LGAATGESAEIRIDPSRGQGVGAVFEGRIEAGDFDRLKTFLLDGPGATEIYLASPGGDLAEAVRIGRLVRFLKLSTVIPSKALTHESRESAAERHDLKNPKANYTCASACFFVFVADIHRGHDNLGPPILGIHRPALSGTVAKALSLNQVDAVNDQMRTAIGHYLNEMGVPLKYADNMFTMPPKGMRWIRNDEFEHDLAGYIPDLRDQLDALCDKRVDLERENAGTKNQSNAEAPTAEQPVTRIQEQLNCERRVQDELALHARESALKIRDSTRP